MTLSEVQALNLIHVFGIWYALCFGLSCWYWGCYIWWFSLNQMYFLVLYAVNLGLGFSQDSILCSDYSDFDTKDNNSSNVTQNLM